MDKTSKLVLYHAAHSTCSQKVRMVLHEKALQFDEVRIDLGKKEQLKPDYLAINPNGVVPTLLDDGVPIIESSVICEYLDEKYPENPLLPTDIVDAGAHPRLDALHRRSRRRRHSRAFIQSRLSLSLREARPKAVREPRDQSASGAPGTVSAHGFAEGIWQGPRSTGRSSSSARPAGAWTTPSPKRARG